jgi:hypothetical protein
MLNSLNLKGSVTRNHVQELASSSQKSSNAHISELM